MKQILIVDDDVYISELLREVLEREGYGVLRAYSGTEALLVLAQSTPDLVLLDLMLPGLSGEELLPRLKGIPTIIVSAKVGVDSKVELLLGGAVDYVTKPFDTKELLARIAVALRLPTAEETRLLHYGSITVDTVNYKVTAAGHELRLTRTEYALLKYLVQNGTAVLSKSQLLDHISLDTPDCTEASLKIHISNLRKKLREATGRDYVQTVWGIGFRMES